MTYKLSIIMAAYNVERYIEESIESFLNQKKDWARLVIVNDGSTDSTDEICKKYSSQKNIHIIEQSNGGLSAARNTGLEYALESSQYISFLDGDDFISPEYLYEFDKAIMKSDSDIIEFNMRRFQDDGKKLSKVHSISYSKPTKLNSSNIKNLMMKYKWHSCSRFYKSDLFNNLRFTVGRRYEDMILTPQLYLIAKEVSSIDLELYYYRFNESGITKNAKVNDVYDVLYGRDAVNNVLKNKISLMAFNFNFIKHFFSIVYNMKTKEEQDKSLRILCDKLGMNLKVTSLLFSQFCNAINLKRYVRKS